jgi:hypothetical protein
MVLLVIYCPFNNDFHQLTDSIDFYHILFAEPMISCLECFVLIRLILFSNSDECALVHFTPGRGTRSPI